MKIRGLKVVDGVFFLPCSGFYSSFISVFYKSFLGALGKLLKNSKYSFPFLFFSSWFKDFLKFYITKPWFTPFVYFYLATLLYSFPSIISEISSSKRFKVWEICRDLFLFSSLILGLKESLTMVPYSLVFSNLALP